MTQAREWLVMWLRDAHAMEEQAETMPNGDAAPGWVLPICGLGHHHDAASPSVGGRSVMSVPMNGSTDSINVDPAWGDHTDLMFPLSYGNVTDSAQGSRA